ncbi:MAG: hypothetical protein QOJ86_1304 [Bradyrhizobium sp.]|jgi:CheY-like chemotaxis protein|nr:hypothetical protein [Bradyrhizobium sp.]
MDAVFSGQAGTLAFLQGADAQVVRTTDAGPDFIILREDVGYLFQGCNDIVVTKGVSDEEARQGLETAWENDRALRLLLIALDMEAEKELRLEAAYCLEEILPSADALAFVEDQLYSQPLPEQADPRFLADKSRWPIIDKLMKRIVAKQSSIALHRRAWDSLPVSFFEEGKARFEEEAIRKGAFKILALLDPQISDPDIAIAECYGVLRSLPNARTVVSEWTKHFKHSGVEPVIVPNKVEDNVKFARTGARPPLQQPQARKTRSQLIAEHLPLLRRYARAMTGNQEPGDASVGDMLEALLQDPSLLDDRYGHRVALFRLFTQVRNSVFNNDDAGSVPPPTSSELQASSLTPVSRQAFLLLSLEGFLEEEVAFILSTSVTEIRKLVEAAGREMAAEIATDVLIIEDETFVAMDLQSLMKNLGHNVIGVARTYSEAMELAKNQKPGLILADIQLADGSSGLDAVNELLRTFEVPVVFITAYPERLLTGERPEPAFLISKPFQPAMISAVASQALFFQRNSRNRAPRTAAS